MVLISYQSFTTPQKTFTAKVFAEDKPDNTDLGHLKPGTNQCENGKVCATLVPGMLAFPRYTSDPICT